MQQARVDDDDEVSWARSWVYAWHRKHGTCAGTERRDVAKNGTDDAHQDAPGPKNNNNNNNKAVSRRRGRNEHTYNLHMNAPAVHHSEIPAILLG